MSGYTEDPTHITAHRPWPLPERPWVMAQRWNRLLFAHWRVPQDSLRPLVPHAWPLDTLDGDAWVTITPFSLTHARPRGLPALPEFSDFLELNCRTYVTIDAKPGVYFFSLDAASRLAVEGARLFYHLPYFRAEMAMEVDRDGSVRYRSRRRDGRSTSAVFRGRYAPVGPAERATAGTVTHWLVERYCLYTVDLTGRPYRAEIHHRPWELSPAECEIEENSVAAAGGITLNGPPALLSYSQQLDVVAWWPARVEGATGT